MRAMRAHINERYGDGRIRSGRAFFDDGGDYQFIWNSMEGGWMFVTTVRGRFGYHTSLFRSKKRAEALDALITESMVKA